MKKQPPFGGLFRAALFSLFFSLPVWLLAAPAYSAGPEAKLTVVRPLKAGDAVSATLQANDYGAKTSATVTVLATATDGAVRGGGGGVGLPFLGALGILAAFAGWRRRLGA